MTSAGNTSAQPALHIEDLTVAYRDTPALWDVDVTVPNGKLAAIIGPNGAGKSTLIKAALGLVPRAAGSVRFFGEDYRDVRRRVAYVPQRSSVDWNFPTDAHDVVTMGTYGHLGWVKRPGKRERDLASHALELVGMSDFAKRQINQLSGGQQQRVFLARALAQQADIYVMDEPFAGVDATTEKAIVQILRALQEDGKTVVVVHHDLETAAEYFDWLILLNVRMIGVGPFDEIFTRENLIKAYGGRIGALGERLVKIGAD